MSAPNPNPTPTPSKKAKARNTRKADYDNAIIYKLTNEETGQVYIGSTATSLKSRLAVHRSYAKGKGNCASAALFANDGKVKAEVIEHYKCNNRRELTDREYYYINNTDCVNKFTRRTGLYYKDPNYNRAYYREYIKDPEKKEKLLQYHRDHYHRNKDKISAYTSNRYKNNEKVKKAHLDRVKAYQARTRHCDVCDMDMKNSVWFKHRKTNKHIANEVSAFIWS